MIYLFRSVLLTSAVMSIIILIMMLLQRFFFQKIQPEFGKFWWHFLLLRLLIPLTIPIPISVSSFFWMQRSWITHSTDEMVQVTFGIEPRWIVRLVTNLENLLESSNLGIFLCLIWICGGFFILIRYAIIWNKLRKNLHQSLSIKNPNWTLQLEKIKQKIKARRNVRLLLSDHVEVPVSFGVLTPCILIPSDFLQENNEALIPVILQHELTHIHTGDLFFKYLWLVAKSIYWFCPFIWLAARQAEESMELYCDVKAVSRIPEEEKITYCKELIAIAKTMKSNALENLSLSLWNKKSKISRRIENLLYEKKRSLILLLCCTILCVFFTFCSFIQLNSPISQKHDPFLAEYNGEDIWVEGTSVMYSSGN